jgi:DNA-binding NarL/FixJ family response regulator
LTAPTLLREIEEYYRRESTKEKIPTKSDDNETEDQKERIQPVPILIDSWSKSNAMAVRRILTMHSLETIEANFVDLSDSELELYFTLTRRIETFQASPSSRNPLSVREMEVLSLIVRGMSNKEISGSLGISHQTVKNHVTSILRKFGVEDRTQAVVYALKRGWVKVKEI